ncbi:PREDICTED: uncharacterized protein LOC105558156 isoform X1 [Vollenhovia emeryi]|uniref:uncharacterized protein LOC105558156 isoform X1 n=1 Tax=Vollenhovia emeryi TaxID=411798 RepID=UPI0005F37D0D|nr:PREDICTED: uncharacterized protein LOC105558156 isoform X1 [Vollenhovia emeryi]
MAARSDFTPRTMNSWWNQRGVNYSVAKMPKDYGGWRRRRGSGRAAQRPAGGRQQEAAADAGHRGGGRGHNEGQRGEGAGAGPEAVGAGEPRGRPAAGRDAVRAARRQAEAEVLVEESQDDADPRHHMRRYLNHHHCLGCAKFVLGQLR